MNVPSENFHVLLVEDNAGDARLLEELLAEETRAPFQIVKRAERLADAIQFLDQYAPDLVLLDPPYGGGRSARGPATTPGRAPGLVPGPGRAAGAASLARATLEWLGSEGLLKAGSRVVAEHHARDELPGRTGALSRVW